MSLIVLSLNLVRLAALSDVSCLKCQSALELHQPDPQLPERLLGTCGNCQSWFLISGESRVMLLLPDEASLGPE